jgi:hypothetical protein
LPDGDGVRWRVLDLPLDEGGGALYFGTPGTWTYADPGPEEKPVSGIAWSPTYLLPDSDDIKLMFEYLVDVRPFESSLPARDHLEVRVVDHLSGEERVLLDSADIPAAHYTEDPPRFHEYAASLTTFAGSIVSFAVSFDSGVPVDDDGLGVVVDDWRVEAVVCPE